MVPPSPSRPPRRREVAFREIVYRLVNRPGGPSKALPVRLAEGRPVTAESVMAHVDAKGRVWRIVHAYGDPDAIATVKRNFERLAEPILVERRVLVHEPRRLALWYKYKPRFDERRGSLTSLAFRHLGTETLATDSARGDTLQVRLVCKQSPRIAAFLKALEREASKSHEFTLLYVGPVRGSPEAGLRPDEEALLRAALDDGYFGVPRTQRVRALGERFGKSPSAVSYALRKAEEKVLRAYFAER